jgi:hypothetical protein
LLGVNGRSLADDKDGKDQKFRLTITAKLTLVLAEKPSQVEADTSFSYALRKKEGEVVVLLNALGIRAKADGEEVMDVVMDRKRIVNTSGGTKRETPFDQADSEQQKLLAALFEAPLCKYEVDKSGKELKRTVTAGADAKSTLDETGLLANVRFFHVPFPEDKESWTATTELSMGSGRYARGDLKYEKVSGRKDDRLVKVKVSGTLTNKEAKLNNGVVIKNAKYEVKGEQTYDLDKREWATGSLTVPITFEMLIGEKVAPCSGEAKVSLGPQK